MKRQPKRNPAVQPTLRIIAGEWRGRKLPIPNADGLRPTGDRLRETLFNWLAPVLPGAHCLDLYAGSGALGFEALSRGAARVTMVESNRHVADQLRANCTTLRAHNAEVAEADALSWLQHAHSHPFNLVFLDPPFAANLWQKTIDALEQQKFLADDALVYVEMPKGQVLETPPNWQLHRSKLASAIFAQLFIRHHPQETTDAQAR